MEIFSKATHTTYIQADHVSMGALWANVEGANGDITDGRERAPLFRINEHRHLPNNPPRQANNIPVWNRGKERDPRERPWSLN